MIVGLCGAAGSGKDTAGSALIDELDYRHAFFAFSLKALLNALFGWAMADWDSLTWKETPNPACYGRTPREVAQSLGTDWGREGVHPDIWVNATMRQLEVARGILSDRVVFTDVRFPNEAEAIREAGGIIIYVTCRDRASGTESNDHLSESYQEWLHAFADAEIAADFGQIDALKEAAVNTVQNYLAGNIPRYEISDEAQTLLDRIDASVNTRMAQQRTTTTNPGE